MSATTLALLTALAWGIAPVAAKLGLAELHPISALIIRSSIITIILISIGLIGGYITPIFSASLRPISFIALEGILASLIGHFTYFLALSSGSASKVVPLTAAFPLFSLLAAVVILSERLTAGRVMGALLIIAGAILIKRN